MCFIAPLARAAGAHGDCARSEHDATRSKLRRDAQHVARAVDVHVMHEGGVRRGKAIRTGHVEDLVFLDLPGRVAKCLLDIADASGLDSVDLTQEDIAGFVGAARVSVNRVLADFEHRRAIRVGRRHIEIADREALRQEIHY